MPKIAFDIELMKPGCVLIQAGMGCDSSIVKDFDPKYWLLAPTPDLRVYEINDDQLQQLVRIVEARHNK